MGCKVAPPLMLLPICLLPVLLLLLLQVHLALSLSPSASQRLGKQRILDLRSSIVQALGLTGIPDLAKANVSQTEYERAHQEYLSKLQLSNDSQRKRFIAVRPSGIQVKGGEIMLRFEPQHHATPTNCSMESQLLRLLPRVNSAESQPLEVRVYEEELGLGRLLARGRLESSRWLELNLRGEHGSRLRLQLVNAATGAHWTRGDWVVSEAALNLQLTCRSSRGREEEGRSRPRRSPRRPLNREKGPWAVRKGRRSDCHSTGANANRCCRHEMSVDFQELEGFEFIVQPKIFDAGFCKGRCPPRYNPAHHHALLQSLIWKSDRTKAPRPCCAPSKLAEIDIMYYDENEPTKLKVSSWKDMRVLECACS